VTLDADTGRNVDDLSRYLIVARYPGCSHAVRHLAVESWIRDPCLEYGRGQRGLRKVAHIAVPDAGVGVAADGDEQVALFIERHAIDAVVVVGHRESGD
jgi:hypothetical protein